MIRLVKIGGNVVDNPELLERFCDDFARLEGDKIIVHGGGVLASKIQKALGQEPVKIEGRRVTDAETLKVVTMVYAGWCNKNLVALLQKRGCNAIGLAGCDAARKHAAVAILIVGEGILDNQAGGFGQESLAVPVSGNDCSVARERQSDGLGQAVHRICGEHPGTASAGRAGGCLDPCDILVADGRIGGTDHCIDEVKLFLPGDACLHRTSGHEDCRNIQTHRCHQHPGSDLVAVADADHRIGLVGIDHVLHTVGDDIS